VILFVEGAIKLVSLGTNPGGFSYPLALLYTVRSGLFLKEVADNPLDAFAALFMFE
jgi:hypothetical protein